jgi:hypothetical protein
VVTDARRYQVAPSWCAETFDLPFYRGLADRAWAEISFAFAQGDPKAEMYEDAPVLSTFAKERVK